MTNLKTKYMGLELKNPIIAGASGLTANLERIRRLESAGVAAIVTASLFEEQIQYERFRVEEKLHEYDNLYAEMTDFFPKVRHAGPQAHLAWVRNAKQTVGIPVIASLNAVTRPVWGEWAAALEQTGVDALELNFYATPTLFDQSGTEIEKEQLEIVAEVKKRVKVPVSVKLSPLYSNPLNMIKRFDELGVDGFVLFNRFFQPDIDPEEEKNLYKHLLSETANQELTLRYAGLLYGNLRGDVCANSGILTGKDVAKMLLAGASCVQVVSTLYRNKIDHLRTMLGEIEQWMQRRGHADLASFRGTMSAQKNKDAGFYRRAQYVKHLLRADYSD
jgi:dihydroorotate dehydrogenase (fumarate)